MNRTALLALCAVFMGFTASASEASAQSFRLNRFRAVERPDDGFGVRRLGAFGHLRAGALLTGDYAHEPLVIERSDGKASHTVVEHQLTLKLDLSLGLWDRLIVFAGIEAVPLLNGPTVPVLFPVPEADGGGLGDVSVGARVRLVGEADDLFGLALQAALIAPTSGSATYLGEERVSVRPEVIAEFRPKVLRISLNLGTLVRPKQQRLLTTRIASDLVYGLGLSVPVHRRVELIGELFGGFALKDFGKKSVTDSEWLLGAKATSAAGLYFAAGAGTGFTNGVGAPDARVIAQLGYLIPQPERRPAPEVAPPASTSVRDRDGDGIVDTSDTCPDVAEDIDGFKDEDGCPEPDNDEDGLLDAQDGCPNEAEDRDQFADEDGCPDLDNDADGVPDVQDSCPLVAGTVEDAGCPPKVRQTEEGELIISEQILFENNASVILPESYPILEAVQRALASHPEILKLRVEGHTDSVGQDFKNLKLSQARAGAVVAWLAEHGTEVVRLLPFGCGEKHPIAEEDTEAGRSQNRRVVFQIVDPAPKDKARARPPAGCRPVPTNVKAQ